MKTREAKLIEKIILRNLKSILNLHYFSSKQKDCRLEQLGVDLYDIKEVITRTEAEMNLKPVDITSYFDVSMNAYQLVDKFIHIYCELYENLQLLEVLGFNSEKEEDENG